MELHAELENLTFFARVPDAVFWAGKERMSTLISLYSIMNVHGTVEAKTTKT